MDMESFRLVIFENLQQLLNVSCKLVSERAVFEN